MFTSNPNHGERIAIGPKMASQLFIFFEEVAEFYGLNSLPNEDEKVFFDGKASLQLNTFLQDAADAAGTQAYPAEGEKIILEDGLANYPFQVFLDELAG